MLRREILNGGFGRGRTCEHVGGDMFENVPNGDAIFMKVSFALFSCRMFFFLCHLYMTMYVFVYIYI